MNILIIHNDNLPEALAQDISSTEGIHADLKIFKMQPTEQVPFDTFTDNKLSEWLTNDKIKYDVIILPFSLTERHIEYTGLRVAAHIRLTKEWNNHEKNRYLSTPILFLGADSTEEVMTFSNIGSLLLSLNTFTTNKTTTEDVVKILNWIQTHKRLISDNYDEIVGTPEYNDLLNRLSSIRPPANYATHHSIANEWAIIRWIDMFTWEEGEIPELDNYGFKAMLYFKYIMAKSGVRDSFTRKWKKLEENKIRPLIKGIEGKKLIFIDDEGGKGWYDLIKKIAINSGAPEPECYPIEKNMDKKQLIKNINDYLHNNKADCYLIDLRLHDDDFKENIKAEELTGFQVAENIVGENKGSQIVFLTASNKYWNHEIKSTRIKSCERIIKESPEYNYSREDTYRNFSRFSEVIRESTKRSYLYDYVVFLNKHKSLDARYWNILDNYIDMLILSPDLSIGTNINNLNLFIESYIDDKFSLAASKILDKARQSVVEQFNADAIALANDRNKIRFSSQTIPLNQLSEESYIDITEKGTLATVLLTLHYHYGISADLVNLVLRLRNERNTIINHHGGTPTITNYELRTIFDKVIVPIIKKDFP